MNAQHQHEIERLFHEAWTLPAEERPAYLAENCSDPRIRSELESLLACASDSTAPSLINAIESVALSVSASGLIGQTVGDYRLTGVTGHGGMGTVYRAVRADDQFEKTVATKMLRFPDGSPAELERAFVQLGDGLSRLSLRGLLHGVRSRQTYAGQPSYRRLNHALRLLTPTPGPQRSLQCKVYLVLNHPFRVSILKLA